MAAPTRTVSAVQPAAFLDRDGVINVDHGYLHRIEDFEFIAGVLPACHALAQAGYALVIITNQSGIGRGRYSEADFHTLTAWMHERFSKADAALAGVYFCPHHPTEALGAYRQSCACRKPAPGMLLKAADDLGLDLSQSLAFGDRARDLQAARSAGIPHRILLGTNGTEPPVELPDSQLATARYPSLAQAVAALINPPKPITNA